MREKISDRIANVLAREGEGELYRMMADSIRVLAVYNGVSWRSELIPDLLRLYRFLGRLEAVNSRLVDEALDKLESEGLVTVEKRVRGSWLRPGTITDKLVRLVDLATTTGILRRDQTFARYMHERYRVVRERLGKG
ncbi:MAG: hypothetical protein ACE5OW_07955 [Candidatus Bathyarchaeia archaeon]